MLTARPKAAELMFQLYGRSLHPELFQVHKSRSIERGGYRAKLDITSAGHLVTFHYQDTTLTEIAASAHHPLPCRRRLLCHNLRGERNDRVECRGVVYEVSFQLEPFAPHVFWMYQEELLRDAERQGLLHVFGSSGRMALGALSYVNAETRHRCLLVQTFHTFPDECAVAKTQSLFQLP